MNKLPAPEQWVLERMSEIEVAEMIEEYIDFIDEDGYSVHLPIVLADGVLLAPDGLDRDRGILFKIQPELREVLPRREDCSETAVREAMKFLCDDWLCDVATDYTGKCTLVAAALSVIERSLLPDRPAFWVTAGKRGGGKTT